MDSDSGVQSSDFYQPYTVSKNQALSFLTDQTKDMVGSKCDFAQSLLTKARSKKS